MSSAVLWVATFQNIGKEFLSPPNAAGLLIATLTMILCHSTLCQTTHFFFVNLVAINPCGQMVVFQFMISSENRILEKKISQTLPWLPNLSQRCPWAAHLTSYSEVKLLSGQLKKTCSYIGLFPGAVNITIVILN